MLIILAIHLIILFEYDRLLFINLALAVEEITSKSFFGDHIIDLNSLRFLQNKYEN